MPTDQAKTAVPPTPSLTAAENLPEVTAVSLDRPTLPCYESLEFMLDVTAEYDKNISPHPSASCTASAGDSAQPSSQARANASSPNKTRA